MKWIWSKSIKRNWIQVTTEPPKKKGDKRKPATKPWKHVRKLKSSKSYAITKHGYTWKQTYIRPKTRHHLISGTIIRSMLIEVFMQMHWSSHQARFSNRVCSTNLTMQQSDKRGGLLRMSRVLHDVMFSKHPSPFVWIFASFSMSSLLVMITLERSTSRLG